MEQMTPYEGLIAARKLISSQDKWRKNRYEDSRNRRCAEGALLSATHWVGHSEARELLKDAIIELHGNRNRMDLVVRWNDDPERTHVEVLAVFDLAIEMASEQAP